MEDGTNLPVGWTIIFPGGSSIGASRGQNCSSWSNRGVHLRHRRGTELVPLATFASLRAG